MLDEPEGQGNQGQTERQLGVQLLGGEGVSDQKHTTLQSGSTQQHVKPAPSWKRLRKAPRCVNRYSPVITALAAVITALATVVIAVLTWRYTSYSTAQWENYLWDTTTLHRQLNHAEAAQRAYVSLGNREGAVGEFRVANDKVSVFLYFFNSGHTPARRFTINAGVGLGSSQAPGIHIARFKVWDPTPRSVFHAGSLVTSGGASDIAGRSEREEFVEQTVVTNTADLEQVKAGTLKGVSVGGTFEYCDEFGGYHCQAFEAVYEPSVDKFVARKTHRDCRLFPPDLSKFRGMKIEMLPRCEQPGEQEPH